MRVAEPRPRSPACPALLFPWHLLATCHLISPSASDLGMDDPHRSSALSPFFSLCQKHFRNAGLRSRLARRQHEVCNVWLGSVPNHATSCNSWLHVMSEDVYTCRREITDRPSIVASEHGRSEPNHSSIQVTFGRE